METARLAETALPPTRMLYSLARAALFRLDPEVAHGLALKSLCALGPGAAFLGAGASTKESRRVMGLEFANPVGVAAGLDKNGEFVDGLGALGFGCIEVGTVTPRPQPGNPKPRLFRLVNDAAIINRMGFNNVGVEQLLRNLERSTWRGVLGINIGKNADTPVEMAADDYLAALEAVYARASYVTINISSPNTKNLRDLQSPAKLDELLGRIAARRDKLADRDGVRKPLVLKVAPDLDGEQIDAIAKIAIHRKIDGLIATNTTVGREGVEHDPLSKQAGGLSGRPLRAKSTAVLHRFARALDHAIPLIGVGGIFSGADAREKIDAGASLVQVYTGFIYRGPDLVVEARKALR